MKISQREALIFHLWSHSKVILVFMSSHELFPASFCSQMGMNENEMNEYLQKNRL